jgi:hypothetical protein
VWRFAGAAVAPDIPYVFLLAYYSVRLRVNGLTNLTAWDLAWRSPLVSALHSLVPWAVAGLALVIGCSAASRRAALPIWAGWFTHIVTDMLTHRSDGYAIFYPLAAYRFPTPISYWEPGYYGRAFTFIDSTLMCALLLRLLFKRWRAQDSSPVVPWVAPGR